jgi:hypothetical protein
MSAAPSSPSAKAPGGVPKISIVYGPAGAPWGHTRLRKFAALIVKPAGIVKLLKYAGNVPAGSDAHAKTIVAPPSVRKTTASSSGHPKSGPAAGGSIALRYTSATTVAPGLAADTPIRKTSPGRTVSRSKVRVTESGGGGGGGGGGGSAPPHDRLVEAVLRGIGAPVVKSAALLPVSVHPPSRRIRAVVLAVVGPGEPSEKLALPQPT